MWKICTIVCRSNTVKLYLNHWSHMRIWTRKLQYIFNQDGYLRCSCGKPSKKLQFLQVVETHAHGTMRMKQAYHHTRGVSCDTGSKPSAWGSDYCQAKLPTVFSQHMMPCGKQIYQGKRSGLPYVCWANLGHLPDCLCMVFLLAIANSYISQKNWTSCADSVCKPIKLIVP